MQKTQSKKSRVFFKKRNNLSKKGKNGHPNQPSIVIITFTDFKIYIVDHQKPNKNAIFKTTYNLYFSRTSSKFSDSFTCNFLVLFLTLQKIFPLKDHVESTHSSARSRFISWILILVKSSEIEIPVPLRIFRRRMISSRVFRLLSLMNVRLRIPLKSLKKSERSLQKVTKK